MVKNSLPMQEDIRDAGLIPGWERSPGGGKSLFLQKIGTLFIECHYLFGGLLDNHSRYFIK